MNFVAKVKIKGKDEAVGVMEAFWDEFNPNSVIHIEGGEASVKIFFDEENLPRKISAALSICDDFEFHYGEAEPGNAELDESDADDKGDSANESKLETDDDCEDGSTNESEIEKDEEHEGESNTPVKGKRGRRKKGSKNKKPAKEKTPRKDSETDSKNLENDKLIEFSKQASSYEEFAELIAKWLELKKRESLFVKLAILSKDISKITWPNLEKAAKENGFSFNVGDRNFMSGPVTQKMKDTNNPLRITDLFAAIALYKDFDFSANKHKNEESVDMFEAQKDELESSEKLVSQKGEEVGQSHSNEDTNGDEKIFHIPALNQLFENIDITKNLEEIIKDVLTPLGLKNIPEKLQRVVVNIVECAIKFDGLCTGTISEDKLYEEIYKISYFQSDDLSAGRLHLSSIVNKYLTNQGYSERVKTYDILKLFQRRLITVI